MKEIRSMQLGDWVVNTSREPVAVRNVPAIEAYLAAYVRSAMPLYAKDYPVLNYPMRTLGIPAPIVRMDMPPATERFLGVYEVEANPSGTGIAHMIGLPILDEVCKTLARVGIDELAYGVAPSRRDQEADLEIFMSALSERGIHTHRVPEVTRKHIGKLPVWLRAGNEDLSLLLAGDEPVMEDCLLCHYDGGGHKGYLLEIGDAKMVSDLNDLEEEPFELFPDGLVLKPKHGWGTRDTHVYVPRTPYKRSGVTRTKMVKLLKDVRELCADEKYIVQPFGPPEIAEDGSFRIWRLYAVWDGSAYRVVGGFWAQRPSSLRIHGADDCVMGPLVV